MKRNNIWQQKRIGEGIGLPLDTYTSLPFIRILNTRYR
jgi:hypothetical protein